MIANTSPRRMLRLAQAAATAGFLLAASMQGGSTGAYSLAASASENLAGAMVLERLAADALRPVERTFLEKAAALSRQQLQLAQLAVSNATSSEVRTYAQQVATDHRQISDSVEGLRRKKGVSAGRAADAIVSEAQQRLAQKSGDDFDREFVKVAGELQAAALTLFEEAMADAKDPDVRDLAGAYLPALRDHHNRATELKKTYD